MKNNKIEDSIKDPVVMKRVIDTILDPRNPDSNKITKIIIKNISDCIAKDDAFLTTVKGIVIEEAQKVTEYNVQKCLNDSKEYLTNALVTTINLRCEEYLQEQKKFVTEIMKKTLDSCVDDILKTTKDNIDKNNKRLSEIDKMDSYEDVKVPSKYKDEVKKYMEFLQMKN